MLQSSRCFKAKSDCNLGCSVTLRKRIPIGAGWAGSSNAATVLKGLNKLWNLRYTKGRAETCSKRYWC